MQLGVYEVKDSARIDDKDYFFLKLIRNVPDILQAQSLLYSQLHKDAESSFKCGLETVFDDGRIQLFSPYDLSDPEKYSAPKWCIGPTNIELVIA